VLIAAMLILVRGETVRPKLGALFDCTNARYKGVFAIPEEKTCQKKFFGTKVDKFKAEVRQYKTRVTVIKMYFCEVRSVVKFCSENFLGIDTKRSTSRFLKVEKRVCANAVKTKDTPYGKLRKIGSNEWGTRNEKGYACSWMVTNKKQEYEVFNIKIFKGSLKGEDR